MTIAAFVTLALFASAAAPQAQDQLTAARDLYASAAYEEALSELNRVSQAGVRPDEGRVVDQYRAFCLFALGRVDQAEAVAESIIRQDPLAELDRADASPRVDAMFAEVRKRLLPQLIRDEYRTARALATEKSPEAPAHLATVSRMLAAAEKIGAWDDTLADLKMLVDGFRDLGRAAAPAPVSPAPVPSMPASSVGRVEPAAGAPLKTAGTSGRVGAPDSEIQPPTALSEPAPRIPPAVMDFIRATHRSGVFELVIDETGAVKEVIVRKSLLPAYDDLFVEQARTWKYRPATRNGRPIGSVKTITLEASSR